MGCFGLAILRTGAMPWWTGSVFAGATFILPGKYALQGAPPFPQLLAFIAIGGAARLPAISKDDRR